MRLSNSFTGGRVRIRCKVNIMRRQMMVREKFRRTDSSDRMKRVMKERIYEYKDMIYEPGAECKFKIALPVGGTVLQ